MTPSLQEWTLAFPGPWNVNLLRPEWVAPRFFGDNAEVEVDLLMGPETTLRMKVGDVVLVPGANKLVIGVRSADPKALTAAEGLATTLLDTFQHLPLAHFGVNFGFDVQDPSEKLAEALLTRDQPALIGLPSRITRTEVTRRLSLYDKTVNFKVSQEADRWHLHLNFHFEAEGPRAIQERLRGSFAECLDLGIRVIEEVYDLQLEVPDGE